MAKTLLPLLLGAALLSPGLGETFDRRVCGEVEGDFFQFSAKTINGTEINFEEYRGKVVMVYNVATYWGITPDSYNQINALAEFYSDEDFVILGFPCNQFGLQEPGVGEEIMNGIRNVRPGGGFEPMMTMFEKTEVNGKTESEIFTFLKSGCAYVDTDFGPVEKLYYSPIKIGDIHWNFEKFLIGRDGKPYIRYHTEVFDLELIKADIDTVLNA